MAATRSNTKLLLLLLSFTLMIGITLMPQPAGLTIVGQRVLAILVFAVIIRRYVAFTKTSVGSGINEDMHNIVALERQEGVNKLFD